MWLIFIGINPFQSYAICVHFVLFLLICVHSCCPCFHSCFACVHLCSPTFCLCSLVSTNFVVVFTHALILFICVLLIFTGVHLCCTCVHWCSICFFTHFLLMFTHVCLCSLVFLPACYFSADRYTICFKKCSTWNLQVVVFFWMHLSNFEE